MAFMRGTDFEKGILEALGLAGRPVVGLTLRMHVGEMATVEVEELVQESAGKSIEFLTRITKFRQEED